jgi:hypothetical protein
MPNDSSHDTRLVLGTSTAQELNSSRSLSSCDRGLVAGFSVLARYRDIPTGTPSDTELVTPAMYCNRGSGLETILHLKPPFSDADYLVSSKEQHSKSILVSASLGVTGISVLENLIESLRCKCCLLMLFHYMEQ